MGDMGEGGQKYQKRGDVLCERPPKYKTDSELENSVFYLVPKHFWCPNWVKSIAHDPAHNNESPRPFPNLVNAVLNLPKQVIFPGILSF